VAKENNDRYQDYVSSEDDNYLRMRVRNRTRWSTIDDYDYWYDPTYSMYYNKPFNTYNPYVYNNWYSSFNRPIWDIYSYGYNSYGYGGYNPYIGYSHGIYGGGGYYPPVYVIKNPVSNVKVSRPSLGSYRNNNYSNSNTNTGRPSFGQVINRVFSPAPSAGYNNTNTYSTPNTNTRSTYEAPTRTYSPPPSSSNTSSSSSSSSSGSSSGSVSRPARSGN
jgi:hypothetical protein